LVTTADTRKREQVLVKNTDETPAVSEDSPLPYWLVDANLVSMKTPTFYRASILGFLLMIAQGAAAVVFEVTTAEEFQAALATAAINEAENEIILKEGTYKGNFKYVAEHSSQLIIRGQGAKLTILDGESRAFVLFLSLGSYTPSVTISGLALKGGKAKTGAALRISSSSLEPFFNWTPELHPRVSLEKIEIFENFGGAGGSIDGSVLDAVGTILTIDEAQVRDNLGESLLNCESSCTVYIKNSSLYGTAGSNGIRDMIRSGSISLEGSFLTNIYLYSSYFMGGDQAIGCVLDDSVFEGIGTIECNARGFSIESSSIAVSTNLGGTGTIKNTTFSDGGISISGERIQFVGNLVKEPAQNVRYVHEFSEYKDLQLISNTIVGIQGITLSPSKTGSSQTVANNIITSSRTDGLSPLFQKEFPESSKLIHNILTEGDYGYWDQDVENIQAEPTFFDVEGKDYHLTSDSIGINGGNNEYVLDDQDFDLDGNSRILGGSVDIGAYERSTTALHPADSNGDQSISQAEFDAYNTAWRTNDTWPTAPSIIPIDFVTRAGYILQKGGAYKNIGVGKPATWVPIDE
jgi:hypothetical protein